jgi:hypothetical protein
VATCQAGTSTTENLAASARAAAVTAAIASAHADPAGPGSTGSGASARHHRVNTTRTVSTRPEKAPQPAAHRPGRPPQQHRDLAVPDSGRPRHERRPDHSGGVRASDEQQHREQHMRRPAAGAPRPPRHDPNRAVRAADRPGPSPAPPGEHARASRTRQPPRSQALLDPAGVGLYREHRASERNHTALPHASGQGHSGRVVAYPDPKIVTVAAPTNPVNTTRPPACRSARSMTPTEPYVVILSGGQHCGQGPLQSTRQPYTGGASTRGLDSLSGA